MQFCVVCTLADVLNVSPNYLAGLTVNKSSNITKEEAKKALGLEMLSDDDLIKLSRLGDRNAEEFLLDSYRPMILHMTRQLHLQHINDTYFLLDPPSNKLLNLFYQILILNIKLIDDI